MPGRSRARACAMQSKENSYTPDQIEILQQAFDILIQSGSAASDAHREDNRAHADLRGAAGRVQRR